MDMPESKARKLMTGLPIDTTKYVINTYESIKKYAWLGIYLHGITTVINELNWTRRRDHNHVSQNGQ